MTPNYYAPYITANTGGYSGFGPTFPTVTTPVVYTGDPGVRNPFFSQGYVSSDPLIYLVSGVSTPPYSVWTPGGAVVNSVAAGVPVPVNIAWPGSGATALTLDSVVMPPAIPPARLFQPPDAYGTGLIQPNTNNAIAGYVGIPDPTPTGLLGGATGGNLPPAVSNASDSGDPWINNLVANQGLNPWVNNVANLPPMYALNNGFTSLPWPYSTLAGTGVGGGAYYGPTSTWPPILQSTGALPPSSLLFPPSLPAGVVPGNLTLYNGNVSFLTVSSNMPAGTIPSALVTTPYLGTGGGGAANPDDRQHPYWRSEMMQAAMNLTTVRTHQYAVWITIGLFEIKKQGDIGMLGQGLPQLAFDIMGKEVGALSGTQVRYRGFFIVDRLKLTGFNYKDVGGFRAAVVYRKIIQ
jgi:hypothetical protein